MVKGISFESLGLEPWLYKGIKSKGYSLPTPIQRKAIPPASAGNDLIAVAKTGSGKTAAFLIPLLQRLREHSSIVGARAAIISPTRELAVQTLRFAMELGKFSSLKFALLVGGDGLKQEFTKLAENPDVIIATPGRLMHFIMELKFSLSKVEIAVLDEADRLVEMGLMDQVKVILTSMTNPARQTLCFSATLPDSLSEFSKTGLSQPLLIKLDQEFRLPEQLALDFYMIRREDKDSALLFLLKSLGDQPTIIFVSTRHHVEYLELLLPILGIKAVGLFGAMDEEARKNALNVFVKRQKNILVTTDVTARGIDIPLLDNVIHYDFPATPKLFIHRSGRAARAGRSGHCYSLVSSSDIPYLIDTFLQIGGRDDNCLGSIPDSILSSELEDIKSALANIDSSELTKKADTIKNATKRYNKTRPSASSESVRRSKEFTYKVHPTFESAPTVVEEFTKKMKEFRPSYNILELNAKISGKDEIAEIMKAKRMKLEKVKQMQLTPQKLTETEIAEFEEIAKNINTLPQSEKKLKRGQMQSFRSVDYIGYDSKKEFEKGKEFTQLSLEMPMDDEKGLRKRDKMVWDNRKKKYIQQQKNNAKIEVDHKAQQLYKEWRKETKKRIQSVGETEDPEIVKKVERRAKDKNFRVSQQETRQKIRKEKYQKKLKHKRTKKIDLARKLEHKITQRSVKGRSKMIIRK